MLILFIVLALIGALVATVGGIWLLIKAFQESILWGLGCIFVPFVSLIFIILKWDDAKKPFLINLAGVGICMLAVFSLPGDFKSRLVQEPLSRGPKMPVFPTEPTAKAAPAPAPKPEANAAVLAELNQRAASLLARKAALKPNDTAAAMQLRTDVLRYNEDLKAATGQELAPSVPAAPIPPSKSPLSRPGT